MVWLTPILYILLKVLSIFVETLDCVKYFVWVVFSLLIPPFIWNREICNLTWTWFWAKTLRLENTISPPGLGREIVLYKTPLFIGRFIHQGCTPRPGLGKNGCPDSENFQDWQVPPNPPRKYWEMFRGRFRENVQTSPKRFGNQKILSSIFLDALASLQTMSDIKWLILVFKISRLQSIREYCRVLQSITMCYRVSQSVTEC